METVLVIGFDGYLGTPLTLKLLSEGYKVIGIDNYSRRINVEKVGSFSAIPILDVDEKIEQFKKIGDFIAVSMDINMDYHTISSLLSYHMPEVVINLAQQPSAPFSHRSRIDTIETTWNNIIGTINILYLIKDIVPNAHLVQIGSMGEYDPASGANIPEGTFDMMYKGKLMKDVLFPRSPGSIYHTSKVCATYFIVNACKWWNIKATDIMQGIVYGSWTPEIEETGIYTRFDTCECFGTVLNKFTLQEVLGIPLTVFGKGEHKRGFLSLNDSINCLMLAIENPPNKGYRTWNQLCEIYTIKGLAEKFGSEIQYINTPRIENTDKFTYNPVVSKLRELGFRQTRGIEDEFKWTYDLLSMFKDELYPLERFIIPEIKWRN